MSRESFQLKTQAEAVAEMERWGDRTIVLQLDIATLLGVVGALQLALRHPQFAQRPSALQVRALIMDLEKQIPAEFPAIKKIINLGFHPRFDQ